ncbi:hypothetical protein ACU5EH_14005 [Aliivibrio salmonicida]|uniref:hypothetical protein n=1 Tax=Aliivibrio salmonicida TaxID=40269 RepID=UPI00406BFD1B
MTAADNSMAEILEHYVQFVATMLVQQNISQQDTVNLHYQSPEFSVGSGQHSAYVNSGDLTQRMNFFPVRDEF